MAEAQARHDDRETSQGAAAALNLRGVNELEAAVLRALRFDRNNEGDGLTATEIAKFGGHDRDSISPRMKGLVADGFVVDTGRTRIPEGKARPQTIWKLAEAAAGPRSASPAAG